MATAAQRMDALETNMAAILAALQGQAAPTDDAPAKTAKDKVIETTARADVVKRGLNPESVLNGDSGVSVVAEGKTGLYRQGSRAKMVRKGRTQVGSLSREEVAYVVANGDAILSAMDTVDKRAKIGAFLPAAAVKA